MSIAIRATNERTADALERQLRLQMRKNDVLKVFSKQEPLFMKMKSVYFWGMDMNRDISISIDGDILIRKNLLNVLRKYFSFLHKEDAGFGVQLFDRFFHRPKFRGLHIYVTSTLPLFLENMSGLETSIRPETDLKKRVGKLGFTWRNDLLKFYVGGLHDYFQWYRDIYFKMLARSHRSPDLVKINYIPNDGTKEYSYVRLGLEEGEKLGNIVLDKTKYSIDFPLEEQDTLDNDLDVELLLNKEIKKHYGLGLWYLASLYPSFQRLLDIRLLLVKSK